MIEPAGAFAGQHVLVTGATGGIGSVIIGKLARENCRISAISRNEQRLKDLEQYIDFLGAKSATYSHDFSKSGDITKLVKKVENKFGPIEVLIWSAGSIQPDLFLNTEIERIDYLINLNLISPLALTRAVLTGMIENGYGRIGLISSVAGSIPLPYVSIYGAAKAGMTHFSKIVSNELRHSEISLTCILPRAVDTTLISGLKSAYRAMNWSVDSPEIVAHETLRAIALQKDELIFGGPEKMFNKLVYLFPGLVKRLFPNMLEQMSPFMDKERI